jgi:hypothetical protein
MDSVYLKGLVSCDRIILKRIWTVSVVKRRYVRWTRCLLLKLNESAEQVVQVIDTGNELIDTASSGDVTKPIWEMPTVATMRPQNEVPCSDPPLPHSPQLLPPPSLPPPPDIHPIFPFCLVFSAELHLPGLIGTARHPDMQIFRIIGFFFLNRLH